MKHTLIALGESENGSNITDMDSKFNLGQQHFRAEKKDGSVVGGAVFTDAGYWGRQYKDMGSRKFMLLRSFL